MPVVINCLIRGGAMTALQRLRGRHLTYIADHVSEILFGGPARGDDGLPQEMMIVLRTDDVAEARRFIDAEPYTASGEVFADVKIRTWSQIVPEAAPGALASAIADERAKAGA